MIRPVESDYTSHVAYARALEYYCDRLEQPKREWVGLSKIELKFLSGNDEYSNLLRAVAETVELRLRMKNDDTFVP